MIKSKRYSVLSKDSFLAVVRDNQGTPIVILNQCQPVGSMTQFQCFTPSHGEAFHAAVKQLGLQPVNIGKFQI